MIKLRDQGETAAKSLGTSRYAYTTHRQKASRELGDPDSAAPRPKQSASLRGSDGWHPAALQLSHTAGLCDEWLEAVARLIQSGNTAHGGFFSRSCNFKRDSKSGEGI